MDCHWILLSLFLLLCIDENNGQIVLSCNDNWELFDCECYHVSVDSLPWLEAEEDCKARGAHLASIHTQRQQAHIEAQGVSSLWIGLSDRLNESQWEWSDHTELSFTSWLPNQPNNGLRIYDQEDCVELTDSLTSDVKGWNDVPCYINRRYICKRPAAVIELQQPTLRPEMKDVHLEWSSGMECVSHMEVWDSSKQQTRQWIFNKYSDPHPDYAVTLSDLEPSHEYRVHVRVVVGRSSSPDMSVVVSTLPGGEGTGNAYDENEACPVECECDDGWIKLLCSCYKVGTHIATWDKAEEECNARAANLVSVHSQQEQLFISSMSSLCWIGLNDKYEEGTMVWSDGSAVDYQYWNQDQPDDGVIYSDDENDYIYIDEGSGWSYGSGSGDGGSGDGGLGDEIPYGSGDIELGDEIPYGPGDGRVQVNEEDCVKNVRNPGSGQSRWADVSCDNELPFVCKKPARIVSAKPPQTYVAEGENNGTAIQLRWRTENRCDAHFNVTHHDNGMTLHSAAGDGGLVLHYQMHQSETGVVHRLHINAMLGADTQQSHAISMLVKPNNYNSP